MYQQYSMYNMTISEFHDWLALVQRLWIDNIHSLSLADFQVK